VVLVVVGLILDEMVVQVVAAVLLMVVQTPVVLELPVKVLMVAMVAARVEPVMVQAVVGVEQLLLAQTVVVIMVEQVAQEHQVV
jgi:hypothetical protein